MNLETFLEKSKYSKDNPEVVAAIVNYIQKIVFTDFQNLFDEVMCYHHGNIPTELHGRWHTEQMRQILPAHIGNQFIAKYKLAFYHCIEESELELVKNPNTEMLMFMLRDKQLVHFIDKIEIDGMIEVQYYTALQNIHQSAVKEGQYDENDRGEPVRDFLIAIHNDKKKALD